MNKLYFRAWLKDEKKMCEVINIYSLDNCTEVTCQAIGGEENDYANYRLDEVILMQGIEIDGKVVYEGDIVELKYETPCPEIHSGRWQVYNKTIELNDLNDLINFSDAIINFEANKFEYEFEVVGNIYEDEDEEQL